MNLKWLIQETIRKELKKLRENNGYLEPFSIEELKRISAGKPSKHNLETVLNYLINTLGKPARSGSSRGVWEVNSTTVLKVGFVFDELDQNKREVKNMKCLGSAFAPNLIDFHSGFYWLLIERLKPVTTEAEFVKLFGERVGMALEPRMTINGIDSNIALVITNLIGGFQTKTYKNLLDSFNQSPWFREMMSKIKKCKMDPGDLNYDNWGIRPSTGELVILDLGF